MAQRILFIGLIGWGCFFQKLPGQDLKSEILKINQAYSEQKGFSAKVLYQWFPSFTATVPGQVIHGEVRKYQKRFYTNYEQAELLINDQYAITINHEEEIVLLQPCPNQFLSSPFTVDLDSALALCISKKLEQKNIQQKIIQLDFGANKYQSIHVIYDVQTHLIQKLVLFFAQPVALDEDLSAQKPRIEIDYQDIQMNPVFNPEVFSERRYFKQMGKTPLLNDSYMNYRLVNYLPR